jgi:hypothetical protein
MENSQKLKENVESVHSMMVSCLPGPGRIRFAPPTSFIESTPHRAFDAQEDARLRHLVSQNPKATWSDLVHCFPGRTTRQIRDRYEHYLAPPIKLEDWTEAEDALLAEKFEMHGPRWSQIKTFFPGRSSGHVKNRWTTLTSRRHKAEREQRISAGEIGSMPLKAPDSEASLAASPEFQIFDDVTDIDPASIDVFGVGW